MTDFRAHRVRSLGLAAAAPVLVSLLLAACSDRSSPTAAGGTTVTTDSSASEGTDATTDVSTTEADDHDHGADTSAAEHDHGADTSTAEHDHGADGASTAADHDHAGGVLDVEALHDLDDELAIGKLDATAQRAVVADYIAQVEDLKPTAGSPEAELLKLLQDLDAALAAGDLAKAAPLAAQAHDAAHELG